VRRDLGARATVTLGLVFAAILPLAGSPPTARAAEGNWPARPMRAVVPFAAGGLNDTISRMVAQGLAERLRQSVVIDNRPGAGGTIGTAIVARAVPDGYTLLFSSSSTIAVSPHLYRELPYDPIRDFMPVSSMATVESVLLVAPGSPVRSVQDLIALARAQPGRIKYGSVGIGSSQHLAGQLFATLAKVDLVHVPYKAAGQVLADTISGLIELDFEPMPTALPHIRAGRLRPIALTSARRSKVMPDLPTIAEAGLPGFELTLWTGILAPRGTPRPHVDRLSLVTRELLASSDLSERLQSLGATPAGDTPEAFARFVAAEIARWGTVVKAAGAKAE
jgi:tripartite-type tricarboxylate transporter receptor subunit TctC